ncbi:MAG TPA: hypothetical protein VGK27_00635 [Candidatus Deferrimicrobiaceae bacterium]|jgi:rhodanese-related sulfurtransferase
MWEVPRIHPSDARIKAQRGEALLVCAYEDEDKYRSLRLDGAISLQEFRALVPTLDRRKEIVFYCA